MGKLGNYILNVFLSFILLLVAVFFFTAEHCLHTFCFAIFTFQVLETLKTLLLQKRI